MRRSLLVAAVLCLAGFSAAAQQYPSRPIKFVAGYPPGGGMDNVSRALGEKLSPRLGQQVVVENRPGAGGAIANDAVAKSAPDGYTLLVGPIGGQAILQYTMPKRTYDFGRDFAAVSRIGYGTIIFVVPAGSKAQSVMDFVAMAKATPGKLNFASSGYGALIHLTGELFRQAPASTSRTSRTRARRRSCPTCSTAASTWRSTARRRTCRT